MDRVNGRPCYCSIGAGGTPCIDRKYCDALREIERLRAALERIANWGDPDFPCDDMKGEADRNYFIYSTMRKIAREALDD